ncbi:MAG TPA: PilT/PilU family type 4a pilus ATPase [Acidimicrobiales bacterium]|nr:PilT/PilU family type 4a pilus ATPase [Acidimicrobiales bacterium]
MKPDPRLRSCIDQLIEAKGTDLLITAGAPPFMRVDQNLTPVPGQPRLQPEDTADMVRSVLGPSVFDQLKVAREVDFPLNWEGRARLRGNAFHQRDTLAMALRLLPFGIPNVSELRLPRAVTEMAGRPSGLFLVTGPTGSGKSTTLASLVAQINRTRQCHILTVEDPIEYLHHHDHAVINQREVGSDTESFASGMRAALREDPDVLMVGEIRDSESAEIALMMAETGHLVLSTLHTNDTAQALDRVVSMFPANQREQVCQQLGNSLAGVVFQRLLPKRGGGQVAAFEVLQPTHAVRNLVREGKTAHLRNAIAVGRAEGMQTLEDSLCELVELGMVELEEAQSRSLHPRDFERLASARLVRSVGQR